MAGIVPNDMEILIDCVKKRPALYLKSLKEYSNMTLRKKLWDEVCSEAVPGWEEVAAERKKTICTEVQRKWNNLRTCFSRELKNQRIKLGPTGIKRRKYIYFDNLLFLKSCISNRPTENNKKSKEDEDEEKDSTKSKNELMRPIKKPSVNILNSYMLQRPTENNMESNGSEVKDSTELNKELTQTAKELKQPTKQPNPNFQETLLHISKDDLDEDKNFVLSLIPTLKSLTEDEKFQAKIEILQVLRKIKNNRINTQKL